MIEFEHTVTEIKATAAAAATEIASSTVETILPADIVTDRGDYLTIKAYLKESERKLVEERKLYAILREDGNRLEQQVV